MVDYTTKPASSSGSGVGLYLAAAAVVAVLLYALFAGGGTTTLDPAALAEDAAATPAVEGTAPVITE